MRSPVAVALIVLGLTAGSGCAARPKPMAWPAESWLVDDAIGLGLVVPDDWLTRRASSGLVASGREGTSAYYTTLTAQTLQPPPGASFASILDSGYTNVAVTNVAIAPAVFQVVDDAVGVRYDIAFDVFDEPRRRIGVLIDAPPYVVDVSCVGPAVTFDAALATFERALATLYFDPTG